MDRGTVLTKKVSVSSHYFGTINAKDVTRRSIGHRVLLAPEVKKKFLLQQAAKTAEDRDAQLAGNPAT